MSVGISLPNRINNTFAVWASSFNDSTVPSLPVNEPVKILTRSPFAKSIWTRFSLIPKRRKITSISASDEH